MKNTHFFRHTQSWPTVLDFSRETSLWIFTMATKPAEKSPTEIWKNVYAPFYTIHQTWVFVVSLQTFRFLGCSSSSLSYTDPVFWSVMPLILLMLLFPNCMNLYYFTKWPLKISPTLILYTFMEHTQNRCADHCYHHVL